MYCAAISASLRQQMILNQVVRSWGLPSSSVQRRLVASEKSATGTPERGVAHFCVASDVVRR